MGCVPLYKGKKFNSLEEVKNFIKDERAIEDANIAIESAKSINKVSDFERRTGWKSQEDMNQAINSLERGINIDEEFALASILKEACK